MVHIAGPRATADYVWTEHLLVVAFGGDVHRFVDGAAMPLIAGDKKERASLHERGDRVAVAIHGNDARLFVLGPDGEVTARFPSASFGLPATGLLGAAIACLLAGFVAGRRRFAP